MRYAGVDAGSVRYAMRRAGYEDRGAIACLALDSGLRESTLQLLLAGRSPHARAETVLALADALQVDPRDLMEVTEDGEGF